jgi:hypothetical protein
MVCFINKHYPQPNRKSLHKISPVAGNKRDLQRSVEAWPRNDIFCSGLIKELEMQLSWTWAVGNLGGARLCAKRQSQHVQRAAAGLRPRCAPKGVSCDTVLAPSPRPSGERAGVRGFEPVKPLASSPRPSPPSGEEREKIRMVSRCAALQRSPQPRLDLKCNVLIVKALANRWMMIYKKFIKAR